MNCIELEESLVESEDGSSREQRAHLSACPACSGLVEELRSIIATAVELRGSAEPSPQVWNSIEMVLRQEGLIRPQPTPRPALSSFSARWGWARWLAPAAAAVLLSAGILLYRASVADKLAQQVSVAAPALDAGMDDNDFLQEIAAQSPQLRPVYEDNLRRANEYIRDAQSAVNEDPNDAEAARSLMDAYQQKAMLFNIAMDRSLP